MAPGAGETAGGKEEPESIVSLFKRIKLNDETAQTASVNSKVSSNLKAVIYEAGVEEGCEGKLGNLLYTVATRYPANALTHRKTFLEYLTSGKINSTAQLDAAFAYLSAVGPEPLNSAELEAKSGVGVVVSDEDAEAAVRSVIESHKERLLAERYRVNVGMLLGKVRLLQPWVDGARASEMIQARMVELLGPKTAEDEKPLPKKKKEKKAPGQDAAPETDAKAGPAAKAAPVGAAAAVAAAPKGEAPAAAVPAEDSDPYAMFPRPEENNMVHTEIFFSNGDIWRPHNTKDALQRHLERTGGKFLTRFPPEPNGYLHIGHAKAMNVSFGLAKERGGSCYLRFDDTNPEAEKQEYIDHIHEIVSWLGWSPFKVTHSADYFQELYDLAVELIKRGCAYVDHQTADEVHEYRKDKKDSPWRNRPIEDSLRLFDDMRCGRLEEGSATLRMKQDMQNDNPNMYDLIAYRIKYAPHPHSGDKWCIYPSYDYTHCLVDSLEDVTHSLCTLEFETRRASYYWLLEALGLYHPYVWEYARLSITNTVLSKRKLNKLVTDGHVDGWDDPRLMTLAGLRRRGASPAAINAFCRAVGITRSDNLIKYELLEHFMRDDLNQNAPRVMVVLHPLRVVVTNLDGDGGGAEQLDARYWPEAKDGAEGGAPPRSGPLTYKIPFSRVLYIERSDFREQDSKDYYGLAPGKTVMLRYAFPVKCTDVVKGEGGEVMELRVEYDRSKSTKPKGVIHWVAEPAPGVGPLKVEVRLLDKLLLSPNPNEAEDWLADLNPNSREVVSGALAVGALRDAPAGSKFQFERIGYFCVDPDSTEENLVLNRTVTLRESYKKA